MNEIEAPSIPAPLVPPGLRRVVIVVVALAVVVFVGLAIHVSGASWAGHLDLGLDRIIDGHRGLRTSWGERVTWLGEPVTVVVVAAIMTGLALLWRRMDLAALAVLGPGVSGLAVIALKPLIGRTIGTTVDGYSFPSGHTSGATSIALVIAVAVVLRTRPGRAVTLALLAGLPLLLGGLTGAGMVAENAHYPTDTIGGFCSALVIGLGLALVIDTVAARQRRTDPVRR